MPVIAYRQLRTNYKIYASSKEQLDDYTTELHERVLRLINSKAMQQRHGVKVLSTLGLLQTVGVDPFTTRS